MERKQAHTPLSFFFLKVVDSIRFTNILRRDVGFRSTSISIERDDYVLRIIESK